MAERENFPLKQVSFKLYDKINCLQGANPEQMGEMAPIKNMRMRFFSFEGPIVLKNDLADNQNQAQGCNTTKSVGDVNLINSN